MQLNFVVVPVGAVAVVVVVVLLLLLPLPLFYYSPPSMNKFTALQYSVNLLYTLYSVMPFCALSDMAIRSKSISAVALHC